MRTSFRAAFAALAIVTVAAGPAAAQGQKLAYIQSSILLEQAPGRAEAEKQFEQETGGFRDQIKRMSDSLNALVAAFEKRQASLSTTARESQTRDLQNREAEYQRRTRELEQRAQQRQGELVQPILDRIKLAIEDVRVEGGYSFIFNADNGSPIVALDKNLNVTDRVLAKLRSMPAAPAPRAGTAPAPSPSGVTRPPQTPPQD